MRSGGMVQRYNNGSLVASSPQRLKWVMENFDLPNEQAAQKFIMAHPEAGLGSELNFPADMSTVDRLAQSVAPTQQLNSLVDSVTTNPYTQAYESGYRGIGVMPGAKTEKEVMDNRAEQSRLKKQYQQYAASQPKPEPDETPDEYRARLEKLLAAQKPSGWENAEKYFAMAQQFLDPSKTTMESLVGAGQAFSQSAGEQARAQREAKLALEKGLLEYDISQSESERERADKKLQSQIGSLQYQGEQAMKVAELHDRIVREAERELADYEESLAGLTTPEERANDPTIKSLKQRIKDANGAKNAALAASAMFQRKYGETYGTYTNAPYWDGEKVVYPQ